MITERSFDRYIKPCTAERYLKRFRGEIRRIFGYDLLINTKGIIIAFVVSTTPEPEYIQQNLF